MTDEPTVATLETSHVRRRAIVFGVALLLLWVALSAVQTYVERVRFAAGGPWQLVEQIPLQSQMGADFSGVYTRAWMARSGISPNAMPPDEMIVFAEPAWAKWPGFYPPLAYFLYAPLTWMSFQHAYLVNGALCHIGLAVTVLCAALLATATSRSGPLVLGSALAIGAAVLVQQVRAYPFLFEIERGNNHTHAMALVSAGVLLLAVWPRLRWTSIWLLSLAAHIKIYPAVFLALPFWRQRWRSLLPIAVVNVVLLAPGGLESIRRIIAARDVAAFQYNWPGNHSAWGFAGSTWDPLVRHVPANWLVRPTLLWPFLLLPIVLCAAGCFAAWRRGASAQGIAIAAGNLVFLTQLATNQGTDYRLPSLVLPIILALVWLVGDFAQEGRTSTFIVGLVVVLITWSLGIAGSDVPWPFLVNKYPFVVAMQATFVLISFGVLDSTRRETSLA